MKVCLACGTAFAAGGWSCPGCGWTPPRDPFLRFAEEEHDHYDVTLYEVLERYEEESFWFRSRNRLIQWAVARYSPHARSFLEVGCGTGYVLDGLRRAFPELQLVGVEMFAAGLEVARRRVPDVELLQADVRTLPYDREFDAVGAFDVLEHIEEDAAALVAIRRVLRPGGTLLVTVPQHPRLWSAADDVAEHKRRYRRAELIRKLRTAGFEVERATSFVTLPFPLMVAARLRSRDSETYRFGREFELPAAVNRGLEAAMTLERRAIAAGVTLPFGGSLLAVARREQE